MHCRFINITNGQMLKILKSVDALNPTVMVSRLHEVFQGYYHLKELSVSDKPDGEFVVSKMDGRGCKQLLDHAAYRCITVKDVVSGDTRASDGRHPHYSVIDEFERNIRIYHDIVCDKCTTARLMCELEKQGHQYVNWPLHQVMYALLNELMLM